VATNRVQLAMSNGPFVDCWQRKKDPYERDLGPRDTIRAVGPSSDSLLQMAVLKESEIKTFMDLKGKRVSLGPKGSNSAWMIQFALKAAGIYDTVRIDSLNWNDAASYMVDHKLDAFGIPNPLPGPAIMQASYSAPVRILDLPDQVINKFIEFSPAYYKGTANCKTLYKGMENQTFTSVAYGVMIVAYKDVPDNIVYEVVRHAYDPKNRDLMVNIAKGWEEGLERAKNQDWLERMKAAGVKIHPGAARFWRERGLKVD